MPTTDAAPKQINRAVAAVETWAKPYLPQTSPEPHKKSPVLALLYSRRPLFPEWANATLSLRGDVDLRHPKFNALRFIYMWLTLALYHWSAASQQFAVCMKGFLCHKRIPDLDPRTACSS